MKPYIIQKIIANLELLHANQIIITWAEQLSKRFKAEVNLYNAIHLDRKNSYNNASVGQGKKISKLILKTLGLLRNIGNSLPHVRKTKFTVEVSNQWQDLIRHIRNDEADLLITEIPNLVFKGKLTALMYNSPCPVLFVREGMTPPTQLKILVPVRVNAQIEQKLPSVITWAKKYGGTVVLSGFIQNGSSSTQELRVHYLMEKMKATLLAAGIEVTTDTAQGTHFGSAILERAKQLQVGLICIGVEPTNFFARLFSKMIGPFFLEHSTVPVLSMPFGTRPAVARALIQTEPFVPYQMHRKVVLAKNQPNEPFMIR
ncbi:universal stress protein [Haliscomenobacter sp.]|uniref:universal stress protein n=1 Tax=Haliscomenobacter sp. TaxID=2717303 RepID=UPI003593646D